MTILRMGHPLLNCRSEEVLDFNSPDLDGIVEQLLEYRDRFEGAGLAAPQLGIAKRIICFGGKTKRYPEAGASPVRILINPIIEPLSDEIESGWEGCLSVPGLRGLVDRFEYIRYTGFDVAGNQISAEASGFEARVLQHEVDHLDGILFPKRIKDFAHFGFEEELVI